MEHKTEFARQALTRRHLLIAGITAIAASFVATPVFAQESDSVQIIFAGSQPVAYGAPGNFTGRVRVDPLFQADKNINVSGAYVTFEPEPVQPGTRIRPVSGWLWSPVSA